MEEMEDDASIVGGEIRKEMEVAPAIIAVHPLEKSVVVAVGSDLRVFDLGRNCPVSLIDDSAGTSHSDAIRAIAFDSNGKLLASAGDDKLVKIWATDSWHCKRTLLSEKRVSAVAISHDGMFVTFADKFGVVWIADLEEDGESQASVDKKALPLLGHYCSIITSLKFSPDGRFIASADRDFKIRITMFPRKPLKGAHEIQSFCLGHNDFVSCLTFACPPDYPDGFLLSGSGDSTVRLWDFMSGRLLDTCEIGAQVGFAESDGAEQESFPVVTDICASSDGSLIMVAIESLHGVVLLRCEYSSKTLSVAKVVLAEEYYVPTSLGLGSSAQCLWMVMGASNLPSLGPGQLLARVRVISGFHKDSTYRCAQDPVVLLDNQVPGGGSLLLKLQGSLDIAKEAAAFAASAAAVKAAMRSLLTKKQYSGEKRELRKRGRNDRKLKQ